MSNVFVLHNDINRILYDILVFSQYMCPNLEIIHGSFTVPS